MLVVMGIAMIQKIGNTWDQTEIAYGLDSICMLLDGVQGFTDSVLEEIGSVENLMLNDIVLAGIYTLRKSPETIFGHDVFTVLPVLPQMALNDENDLAPYFLLAKLTNHYISEILAFLLRK